MSGPSDQRASDGQVAGAAIAAAAAAAASASLLALNPFLFLYVFPVALFHAYAVALPIYLVLSRRRRLTLGAVLGWSFMVGAVPMTLLFSLLSLQQSPGFDAWSAGVQTVEDGRRTAYGWLMVAVGAVECGLFGMVGGGAFWWVMRRHVAPRGPGPSSRLI